MEISNRAQRAPPAGTRFASGWASSGNKRRNATPFSVVLFVWVGLQWNYTGQSFRVSVDGCASSWGTR